MTETRSCDYGKLNNENDYFFLISTRSKSCPVLHRIGKKSSLTGSVAFNAGITAAVLAVVQKPVIIEDYM